MKFNPVQAIPSWLPSFQRYAPSLPRQTAVYVTGMSLNVCFFVQVGSFEKELQELKKIHNCVPALSSEEDMSSLKTFATNLQNFQKDITETMQVVNRRCTQKWKITYQTFIVVPVSTILCHFQMLRLSLSNVTSIFIISFQLLIKKQKGKYHKEYIL